MFESSTKYKVKIIDSPWQDSLEVHMRMYANGKIYAPKPIELIFEEKREGEFIEPFFKILSRENHAKSLVQALIDAGIEIGVNPTGYVPPKAEVDAIRYHLEDMRSLVFMKGKK